MKIPHLTFIVHSLFSNHLLWKKDFLLGVVNLEIDNLLKLLIFNIVICGDKVRYFYFLWAVVNNPLQTLIFCSKAHGKYEVNVVFWLVGKMGPSSPLGIACSDPLQKKKKKGHGGDLKVHNCQTMSAMKSQKVAEDSQNKENMNKVLGFIVLQTQLSFFPGSQNHLNKSFLIFTEAKSFCNKKNPLLSKLVGLRWLDISLVLFWPFYGRWLHLGT